MSNTETSTLAQVASERPPFYRDAVVVKWLIQVVTLVLLIAGIIFLANQAGSNLEAQDIALSYDFLGDNPSIGLSEGIDKNPATGAKALWVGMVNTLRMSLGGIIVATILGVLVGVARLSDNFMASRIANAFIEYMRNIPLLVHIILIFSVIASLGSIETAQEVVEVDGKHVLQPIRQPSGDFISDTGPIPGVLHITNKGVSMPRPHMADGFYQWMIFIAIGATIGYFVRRYLQRKQDETGNTTRSGLAMFAIVAVFGVIGWFAHPIFGGFGAPFTAIGNAAKNISPELVKAILTMAAIGGSALWIKRFLDARRTPAGLARLSDDDYFSMIFAGVAGLIATFFIWRIIPNCGQWIISAISGLFEWFGSKFGEGRTNWREDPPIDVAMPRLVGKRFANYGNSGLNFSQSLAAIFFALVGYTAAFIAEIVRGGILAVAKGQTEAAQAIGLSRSLMLRKVVLPQAFRISLPPLGNQYLNLTKNTSLAIAVGYSDVVQVGQTLLNQTGKTLEVFSIWMLFFLICSLTISTIVNFFNVRLKIVER